MDDQKDIPLLMRYNKDAIVGHDNDDEAYERMPIQNFGLQMLKSMGWEEGKGLGLNPQNALLNPVEFVPRHHRLGLGAVPRPIPGKDGKDGKEGKKDLIAAPTKDGKTRNYINIGEKLVERKEQKVEVNGRVLITGGKHKNLNGIVIVIDEDKASAIVQLDLSEDNVRVPLADLKPMSEELSNGKKRNPYVDDRMERGFDNDSEDDSEKKSKKEKPLKKKTIKWVTPGIRVRVINKKYKDGKFYNKKFVVTDIVDRKTFALVSEKGEVCDELREKDLETIIPKIGGQVKILVGPNKGMVGTLMTRDKDKNKVQIQLLDTLEIVSCTQDDCSEIAKVQ